MRHRIRTVDDSGESLIELVATIAILGVCVVALGTGMALSVKISSIHRDQARAQAYLHNFAEAIQNQYTTCSGGAPPNYVSLASLTAPPGFATPTAAVKFWDASASPASFTTAACPVTDPGLQRVTLGLRSADGFVSESLVVVVRKTT